MKYHGIDGDPKQSSSRLGVENRQYVLLALVLLGGLLVRLSYLQELRAFPEFLAPLEYQTDMAFTDNSAFDMACMAREWVGLPAMERRYNRPVRWTQDADSFLGRPPAYLFFLATLYFLWGDNQVAIRVVQMLLGMVGILLGRRLACRIHGRGTALLTAVGLSFYWPLIVYESSLHAPGMTIFAALVFMNAAASWARHRSWLRAVAAGGAFGFFTLAVSSVAIFLPVLLAWMVWLFWRHEPVFPFRRMVLQAMLCIFCFVLPVVPFMAMKYAVSGTVVLLSYGSGITLFLGNQPESEGYLLPGDAMLDRYLTEEQRMLEPHEKAALVPWPEVSRTAYEETRADIREHPGWFIRLTLKRAVLFWTPKEVSQNITEYCDRLFSRTLYWLPGNFTMVFALFVMGLGFFARQCLGGVTGGRRKRNAGEAPQLSMDLDVGVLLLLFMLVWYGPYCVFWVSAHFRAPLLPFLLLFGAMGLVEAVRLARARQWRGLVWGAVGPATVLPIMLLTPVNYDDDIERWTYFRTRHYMEQGQLDRAAAIARRVVERAPEHAFAQNMYATILLNQGDRAGALPHFEQALARDAGKLDRCGLLTTIGTLRRDLGDPAGAERAFLEAVQCDGNQEAALRALGQFAFERGAHREAIGYLEQAAQLAPEKSNTFFVIGLAYGGLGDRVQAEAAFRRGIAAAPDDIWPLLGLARLLVEEGRGEEACALYRQVLALAPDNESARTGVTATCEE